MELLDQVCADIAAAYAVRAPEAIPALALVAVSTPPGTRTERSVTPLAPGAPQNCPASMVSIPSGSFLMGTVEGGGADDELPQHPAQITGFCMDLTELTVERYVGCVEAGGCVAPSTLPSAGVAWQDVCHGLRSDRSAHPVNCVTWAKAKNFCRWMGGRLPTEAECQYAARGGDTRRFPRPGAAASRKRWLRDDCRQ